MTDLEPAPQCRIRSFAPEKVASIRARLAQQEQEIERFARVFDGLGNRNRLRILLALEHEELCVCDVAQVLKLSVAATSHQLRALHERGWLKMRNDGKMVYYRLLPSVLHEVLRQGRIFLGDKIAS